MNGSSQLSAVSSQPEAESRTLTAESSPPYFRTAERLAALRSTLHDWAGTRWGQAGTRPNEMQCGITGDCLFWVHVFKAIGALPADLKIPDYRKREAAIDNMSRLRVCIESTGRAQLVLSCQPSAVSTQPEVVGRVPSRGEVADSRMLKAESSLIPGDVLLFGNGMSGVHCGLIVRQSQLGGATLPGGASVPACGSFVHLSTNGLAEEPLNQAHWLSALAFVYRLIEPAQSYQRSAISHQKERER